MRKVVVSGMIGNGLEWYDYALYGHFAALISRLFFPSDNHYVSLLATFGVFAAGFLMRPIGAVLFGYIGDKYGRRTALSLSIILMAVPTACIGFLPTYESIGIFAPIGLTVIRLLQGLSLGGAFSGFISFLGEHANDKKRGIIGSTSMFSMCVGILVGSAVATLVSRLPVEDFESWGWRVPFVAGIAIGLVGFYIKAHVAESPRFLRAQSEGDISSTPVRELFAKNNKEFFTGFGLYLSVCVPFYILVVFMNNFMSVYVGKPISEALFINTVAMFFLTVFILIGGHLSDKYGRKPILTIGASGLFLVSWPVFLMLEQPGMIIPMIGQSIFAVFLALFIGPIPATLVELFPTRLRYTGLALAYNIPIAIFGGTAPMVATWLIHKTGLNYSIAFYIMLFNIATIYTLKTFKDRYSEPLN
jgi:MHS family proline/betaine transporter-like MFS transporter